MDRDHRALLPKGPAFKPHGVICRVHFYPLKEDIMRNARSNCKVVFDNTPVQLYPELSWISLGSPEDLEAFCNALGIPVPQLHDWDLVATPPPPPVVLQKVSPTKHPRARIPPAKPPNTKKADFPRASPCITSVP